MMRAVVQSALRFRALVVGAAAVVMIVGISQLREAPVDVLPEFTPPYVEVQTEALGLSATEVEDLITTPMESDVLNGVAGLDTIRSESISGLSSITLVFEPDTDILAARQLVQERLTQARALPNVSKPPTMLQPLSSTSRVIMIGLSSQALTPLERSVLARWTIRPRLMGVPGVANVAIWGQREQQLQVRVDPEELRDRGVSLQQVISSTGNAQIFSPLTYLRASTPGSGGFVDTPNQRLQIRAILPIATPKELGGVSLDDTGGKVRLGDVTQIVEDHQPLIGDAVVNDGPGLLLAVEKLPGANTLEVTEGIEQALDDLRPGLSDMQVDSSIFRPATYIESALDNLTLVWVLGLALLALALAALVLEWRSVLVGLVAVPVALVTALLVLVLRGETINALVIAGLAVALGVVVDDAVAGAHSARQRLRERAVGDGSESIPATVLEATVHSRRPLGYATLIALLAVLPLLALEGRPGEFFEPLGVSYVLAVVASLVVALTVTPALTALLFARPPRRERGAPLMGRLTAGYDGLLARSVQRPRAALAAAAVLGVAAIVAFSLAGRSPVPSFEDRDLLVQLAAAPGTSNAEMTRIAGRVGGELRTVPGIKNVGAHVGRAVTSDRIVDVNVSELWVSLDAHADYDATVSRVRAVVDGYPGLDDDVVTYATQRIREVGALDDGENDTATDEGLDVLTGADEPLVVRVYGQDREVLRRKAGDVQRLMAGVDGVVDPQLKLPVATPTIEIEVDLASGRRAGITPGDVRRQAAILVQGIDAGALFEEQKVFDVVVRGDTSQGHSLTSVRNLLLDTPSGGNVRLGDVADVRLTAIPTVLRHEAISRYVDVAASVDGRSVGAAAQDVGQRLEDHRFPLEYHAEVLRGDEPSEAGGGRVLAVAIAAAIGILLVLQAAVGSWRLAALFFLVLPASPAGGVLAALLFHGELSLGALAGLLLVLGIAARNGLASVQVVQPGADEEDVREEPVVGAAAVDRVRPVLTTAVALGLVLAPVVLIGGAAGLEILNPMAVAVLGGLVSATLVTLFVVPVLPVLAAARRVEEPAPPPPLPQPV